MHYGAKPIEEASCYGSATTVAMLIQNGADVDAYTSDGGTSLFLASMHGNVDIVNILIPNQTDIETYIDDDDDDGIVMTALFVAVGYGYADLVNYLLQLGADRNVTVTMKAHSNQDQRMFLSHLPKPVSLNVCQNNAEPFADESPRYI